MELQDDGMCFACGPNNPIGLRLDFQFEGDRYVARFVPRAEHQGYDNIIHGGIIGTLLDEAMAKLVYAKGTPAVTVDLRVTFRKAARIGEELVVSGWIVSETRRAFECAAEARNASGELIAEGAGRLLKV